MQHGDQPVQLLDHGPVGVQVEVAVERAQVERALVGQLLQRGPPTGAQRRGEPAERLLEGVVQQRLALVLPLDVGPAHLVEVGEADDDLPQVAGGGDAPQRCLRRRLHGLGAVVHQHDGLDLVEALHQRAGQRRSRLGDVAEALAVGDGHAQQGWRPRRGERPAQAQAVDDGGQQPPEQRRLVG